MTQADQLVGSTIGQFTIVEEIGRGGMATVYRATQQSINRDVALKALPPAFLHDPGFYERFTREVDVVARLEHPHIVPIYDFGEFEGMPYIVMRLLAGGSLRTIIQRESPELRDLVKPVQQIASALDFAHQHGIIHRDLKPGNMLLDASGNAYLSDFGIARVLNSDLTGSALIGTPAYMSPEQAKGESLDARSDVYALGVVIFELITGREPFIAETPIAMILKHLNERVPYLSEFRTDIPHEVDKVIAKATEKHPDQRYSSAGALAEAFSDAVRGTASTVSIPTDTARELKQVSEAETLPPPGEQDTEPDPRLGEARRTPPPTPTPDLDGLTVTPAGGTPITNRDVVKSTDGDHTVFTTDVTQEKRKNSPRTGLWAAAVALIVAIGGVLLFNPFGAAPAPTVATPFTSAQTVQTDTYSISIPQKWLPADTTYYDILEAGDERTLLHAWQDVNLTALITVAAKDEATPVEYINTYYTGRGGFTVIDSTTFPDGTMRYSYRTTGFNEFPAGQMDVFLLPREGQLVAVEMYSADETGSNLVPTFQQILDSFRLQL